MTGLLGGQGFFFSPTVLANATIDMAIFREETFGPAIPLFRFKTDSEAVQLANNTDYGLAAYFWTQVRRSLVALNAHLGGQPWESCCMAVACQGHPGSLSHFTTDSKMVQLGIAMSTVKPPAS